MYNNLKNIRKEKGYTIIDLGNVIGKSPASYYKKEEGSIIFTVEEALKIADFLKISVETLFKN